MAKVKDPYEILDIVEERIKIYAARNVWYDRLMRYYRGSEHGTGSYMPDIMIANSQGRPLLRQVGESINVNRAYSSQRLSPIVDDYASLIGRMPTVRVDVPDPSPQGEEKAETETKFLYSTYELSNMAYQQAEAGFYLSSLGDAVYVLDPDGETNRVVWSIMNPAVCYPSFYKGFRRMQVFDMVTVEWWAAEDIENNLNVTPYSEEEDDCKVIHFISPFQRTVLVGSRPERLKVGPHAGWDLGFCPAVWVYNKVTGSMGMSDIGNSLGQQDFLDYAFNVWADGIVYMTYPLIGIKNPMNVGEAMNTGPGEPPVLLQGDGDVIVRQTQSNPAAIAEIINLTLGDMSAVTGSSPVRQEGAQPVSHLTGRAVHAVQGPQSTRIDFKQQVMGEAIRELNSRTLAMQETAPGLKNFKGDIYGRWKGQSFTQTFSAQDIDGWYRNTVTWEQLVGMNQQQKLQIAYEGMVAKVWDRQFAMQMVGVDDPIAMEKRVQAQAEEDARLQMKLQQGAAPGPPGGAAGGVAGPPTQQGGQAPIPMIRRPSALAGSPAQQAGVGRQPAPEKPPAPPSADDLKKVLLPISDTLKGEVWKVGDLILAITDHRDYVKVVNATKQAGKFIVRYVAKDELPDGSERIV